MKLSKFQKQFINGIFWIKLVHIKKTWFVEKAGKSKNQIPFWKLEIDYVFVPF